jgi:hypothetical protein
MATSVWLGNTSGSPADTCFEHFDNLLVLANYGAGHNHYGVYLGACDDNLIENYHWTITGSGGTGYPVFYDYTVNPSWPAGNTIDHADWGAAPQRLAARLAVVRHPTI